MGRTVCETVAADADLELVSAIDLRAGENVSGVDVYADPERMVVTGAEVAVDFTAPSAVKENVRFCIDNGIHAVVGTTGMSERDLEDIAGWVAGGGAPPGAGGRRANVFVAPNFSVGAVLMMHFAKQAAPHFGSAEVIELHHNQKLDAPSGTAHKTAREIAEMWGKQGRPPGGEAAPNERKVVDHARGGNVDGVRVHSVRLRGFVAHQEVLFGGPGELLTIRHDTMDRISFMPGVLLAVKTIASRPGLTVGLEHLLDL
jgi:4-hydroxy-tetrahydrodipicolinate reductase